MLYYKATIDIIKEIFEKMHFTILENSKLKLTGTEIVDISKERFFLYHPVRKFAKTLYATSVAFVDSYAKAQTNFKTLTFSYYLYRIVATFHGSFLQYAYYRTAVRVVHVRARATIPIN